MKKVLLVDDEPFVLKGLALVVDNWGYYPLMAASGREALLRIDENGPPDALLTDYRLRDEETGIDVITAVRAHCGTLVPAVLLTGDTEPARLRKLARSDVPVLHKPVLPDRIRMLLAVLTDDASGRQADPMHLRNRLAATRAFARR